MMVASDTSDRLDKIEKLIEEFRSPDGLERRRARLEVTEYGWEAVPELINAMSDSNGHVRWEAAKALGKINDPSAAMALVHALDDESMDVRGAVAEGLINLGRGAVLPLLQELTQHFDSVLLRDGARHVFHILNNRGLLSQEEIKVFEALGDIAPEVEVPWAAHRALEQLYLKKNR